MPDTVGRMLGVVGHTTRDVVDGLAPRAGGPPLYAARALQAMGERGVIVTRCAAADEELVAPLRGGATAVTWRPGAVSASFRLRYEHGVRTVAVEALAEPWLPSDVDGWLGDALEQADWVYAAALWRGEFPAATLARLADGRRLALDGHGLVRPGVLGRVVPDADFDPAVLEHISAVHLSENEARVMGLELEPASLAGLGVPEVIVTLGERGAIVFDCGELHAVPADPVPGADPTGAGDSFMTAYLARRRAGIPPGDAARSAAAVVRGLLTASAA